MDLYRQSRVGIFLVGLPVISNIVSFIVFAPLFAPDRMSTPDDFRQAGIFFSIAILVIEVIAVFLLTLNLRREHMTWKNIINLQPHKLRLYLIIGLIALPLTLVAGWLYSLGQAQAGAESDLSQLTRGEIAYWYVLIPLAAAFLEESIWRGYAIPRIKGAWRGLLFSSLSFALFHGVFNPLAVVATFAQGLIWGWAYQRTDSTIPSITLHFISRYLALFY